MQNLINSLLSLQCHHSHHSGLDNRIHLELLSSCKWFCHRVFQSTCEDFLWQKYCWQQLKKSKSILLNATINTVTTATIVIIGISISIMIIKTGITITWNLTWNINHVSSWKLEQKMEAADKLLSARVNNRRKPGDFRSTKFCWIFIVVKCAKSKSTFVK